MTQKFSLYEDLSVRENLEFMTEIYAMSRSQARARIGELLDRFDLADRQGQLAGTMSGGQKQRLALAAATLHDPELMFLDEPTSAVDPESRRQFWEYLFAMVDEGKTILVSTHFMDEAERCHRIAILDEGRLVAEGVPDDLMHDIGVSVVEIQAGHTREVREAILASDIVLHVAQLGSKLHALVKPEVADPVDRVREVVGAARGGARLELRRVDASLEDVFVVATMER
jgi:ABC-2 type transport system ATP-binding protein